MNDFKYLDYEGLALFKEKLDALRLSDKNDIVLALNELSLDIGNGKLTISINNVPISEFTANLIGNENANISVPTSLNDLIDAVEFIKNIIKYGLSDVSNLTDEQKNSLHDLVAEESEFVSENQLLNTLTNYGNIINYDSASQTVQLKNGDTILSSFSAADFVKDSFIQDILVTYGTGENAGQKVLLIDFNSESGITDIEIPISEFFNPDNYYVKNDFATVATSGDYNNLLNRPSTLTLQDVNTGTDQTGKLVTAKIIKDTVYNALYGTGDSDSTVITTSNLENEVLNAGFAKSVLVGNNTPTIADANGVLYVPAQVQADWNETTTTSKAYILNKPIVYSLNDILNIIKYGQPDVSELTDEEKDNAENLLAQNTGYVKASSLSDVAFSGNYTDLINVPTDLSDFTNNNSTYLTQSSLTGYVQEGSLSLVAFSGDYDDLSNKPTIPTIPEIPTYNLLLDENDLDKFYLRANNTIISTIDLDLASVAISGSYNDLINKPDVYTKSEVDTKILESGIFDSTLYYTKNDIDNAGYLTLHQDISGKANSSDLSTVATSGSYNDLTDKPTLFGGTYNTLEYVGTSIASNGGQISLDGNTYNLYKITLSGNVSGITFSSVPENYHSCHVIIKANDSTERTIYMSNGALITIDNITYTLICPEESTYTLKTTSIKYVEFDVLRIDNELFVRGI